MGVITAEQFYQQTRRKELTLPTGIVVEIRRLDIQGTMVKRQIPRARILAVSIMLERWNAAATEAEQQDAVLAHGDDIITTINDFVLDVVARPTVTAQPTPGAIYVEDLSLAERLTIVTEAHMLTKPAAPPPAPAADVDLTQL